MRLHPPPDLIDLFLAPKEDTWTILKAFFQRDGEAARLRVVSVERGPEAIYA